MSATLTKALKKCMLVVVLLLGAFILYALSLGPAFWLCGFTHDTKWSSLPSGVQLVYSPLNHIPWPVVYERYLLLWIK
jgi:hypothetical protein